MNRRWGIILVLVAVVAGGIFYLGRLRGPSASPEEAEVVTVERGTLVATVSASGRVAAAEDRTLFFATSGQVAEILVDEGDEVQAGQTLARLDTADLELQLAQAEAPLAGARARLAQVSQGPSEDEIAVAAAQLELARLNLEQAQAAWDRVSWQPGAGALPQGPALQKAIVDYQQAQANYNLVAEGPSDEEIAQAQAEVDRAQAAVEQIQLQLDRAVLVAPFSGTVAEVMVQEGQITSPGSPAFRLLDLSRMPIELDIDEIDIGQIQVGQKALVTLDALPGVELEGRIDFVASAATAEGGVVTYTVRLVLEDNDPGLRVGMTANVAIETQRGEGLLIPNRAVQVDRETGRFYVEKVTPQGSILVEITPGLSNESLTQVLGGLEEGDQVIIRPISGQELLRGTFTFGEE